MHKAHRYSCYYGIDDILIFINDIDNTLLHITIIYDTFKYELNRN